MVLRVVPIWGKLAAGENKFVDEITGAEWCVTLVGAYRGDAMIQGQAIRGEQIQYLSEIARQPFDANMFKHADTGDPVEAAGEVAIIHQADFHPVLQACQAYPPCGFGILLLGQGDAQAFDIELTRRADEQRTPAAADVQQGMTVLQFHLGEDMVDFLDLRRCQCFIPLREIGAGVHHFRVQPLCVKMVGHIVVVLDGLAIGPAIV
jgi:hypothetical protein